MKKDFSEIITVLDRSGSMEFLWADAIGGFNNFLKEQQKEPGSAKLTLVHFDTEYEMPINGVNIQDVKPICQSEEGSVQVQPRGMTALLDALGKTIHDVGNRLEKTPENERPEHVIFAVITDGQENSSKEFTRDQIKKMIELQTNDYNWNFVFLSADVNAMYDSQTYGFQVANTMSFSNTADGFAKGYSRISTYVSGTRSGSSRTLREDDEGDYLESDK